MLWFSLFCFLSRRVVIVLYLIQIHILLQPIHITNVIVNCVPVHCEAQSILLCLNVSVIYSLWVFYSHIVHQKTNRNSIAKIFLKVALKTSN